jgi:peptidoglycan/xylan/chitin deacetylase (PgdA/CDA1 family)
MIRTVADFSMRANKAVGCMLLLHRAAKQEDWDSLPNRGFYVNLAFLDRLLAALVREGWKVVTVDGLLQGLQSGGKGDRYVNFSVDDCYRDTWEHIVPLFRRHGLPVTLFVTTGIPDGTHLLAWAGLESILQSKDRIVFEDRTLDVSGPGAKRHWYRQIIHSWQGPRPVPHVILTDAYIEFCKKNAFDPAALREGHAITWDMLESLSGDPLVEIGAHTISHPHISGLAEKEAMWEMAVSREQIRSRLRVPCSHFAFPYGRRAHCGERDFALARRAGFASAVTTRWGLLTKNQDPYSLPRNGLNGAWQSMAHVKLVMSGLAGYAARMLGRV